MNTSARRWLLHRRKQRIDTLPFWRELELRCGCRLGWQRTYWRVMDDLSEDECKPELPSRITRVIRAKTRPLPAVVDENAPTEPGPAVWRYYADETLADRNATIPMALAEIRR